MKRRKLNNDMEILNEGIKALHKALGPVEAHAFMGLVMRRKTDYVKVSRKMYKGQSVEEIFECAKAAGQ